MSTGDFMDDKPLLNVVFQTKSSVFESVGYEGGHRKSLIPAVTFEVILQIYDCICSGLQFVDRFSVSLRSSKTRVVFPQRCS